MGNRNRGWGPLQAASLLLAIAVLALAFGASSVSAQRPAIADATIQRGLIKVRTEGRERVFRETGLKIPLYETDVVHTGRDTRATITVRETGETITLYSDSHLRMAEVRKLRSNFQLAVGKALFLVRRIEELLRETTVETQSATVGVKGTEFVVGTQEDESYVLTVDGTVAVRPTAAPGREVAVKPGQAYYAAADRAAERPVEVSAQVQKRVVEEEGLDALRRASGAPERPRPPREPLGLRMRLGPALQRLDVPFEGGSASSLTVNSPGVLFGVEVPVIGPFTLDVAGFRGLVDSASGGAPGAEPSGGGGAVSTIAVLAGIRGSLGASIDGSIHAGLQRSWVQFPRTDGETLKLEEHGGALRIGMDYLWNPVWAIGLAYQISGIESSGSLVDRVKQEGAEAGTGRAQLVAFTVSARF